MGPSLVGVFQTLISITNVERAQQGQPGLILGLAREGELEFTRAAYPAPREGDGVDLIYNLRPACGLLGDTLVISTHEDLMRELASELGAPGSRAGAPEGEHLRLAGAQLAQFVEANRELLIAQNQVDEGNSRPQAELEIGALHAGLALVRSAQLGVSWPGGGDVQLSISLSIQGADEEYGGSR